MTTTEDMVDEMLQYLLDRIDDFDEDDTIDDLFIVDGAPQTGAVIDKLRQLCNDYRKARNSESGVVIIKTH